MCEIIIPFKKFICVTHFLELFIWYTGGHFQGTMSIGTWKSFFKRVLLSFHLFFRYWMSVIKWRPLYGMSVWRDEKYKYLIFRIYFGCLLLHKLVYTTEKRNKFPISIKYLIKISFFFCFSDQFILGHSKISVYNTWLLFSFERLESCSFSAVT